LAGGIGFSTIGGVVPPGIPLWIGKSCTAAVALLGCAPLIWGVRSIICPFNIRHAAPSILPTVPSEPVIFEGSVVHGRLTHELWEDASGWQFRPSGRLWHNDKVLLLGFSVFLVIFSALLTWVFHNELRLTSWFLSTICGTTVTTICGGSVLLMIGMIMRSSYRRLSRLSIPRNGGDLELDAPEELKPEKTELSEGLKWLFLGETKRRRLTIPRDLVLAVQICPWRFVTNHDISWAVQGLLVLASPEEAVYHRLPILLTSDFVGAARLMQRLADALHVPYLFCADAEGWKAEKIRAKERPPLQIGGSQT
jgi:hypothetical protein